MGISLCTILPNSIMHKYLVLMNSTENHFWFHIQPATCHTLVRRVGEWGEFRQPFVPYFADYKHQVNHDNVKQKAGGATYRFAYTVLRTLCKRKQNGTCAQLR